MPWPLIAAGLGTAGVGFLGGGLSLFRKKPKEKDASRQFAAALAQLQEAKQAGPMYGVWRKGQEDLRNRFARMNLLGSGMQEAAERQLTTEGMSAIQRYQAQIAQRMADLMAGRASQAYASQEEQQAAHKKAQADFWGSLVGMGGTMAMGGLGGMGGAGGAPALAGGAGAGGTFWNPETGQWVWGGMGS